jgi:hypothetical protein
VLPTEVYAADADVLIRHWRLLIAAGIIEAEDASSEDDE